MRLQSTSTIDLSVPDSPARVNEENADNLRTVPITNLPSANDTFSVGRTVAITEKWFAYALSKGEAFFADHTILMKLTHQAESA